MNQNINMQNNINKQNEIYNETVCVAFLKVNALTLYNSLS